MDSKEIIVELIVIGFGFFVLIVLTGYYFDKKSIELLINLPPLLLVFPITIFCYVVGIVVDRVADLLFSIPEDCVRGKNMPSGTSFKNARSLVFSQSPHVKEWVEYGRIRIRVVRGWSFNLLLIISLIVWSYVSDGHHHLFGRYQVFISAAISIMLLGCVYSWFSLTKSECRRIEQEYSRIKENVKI